jgi:hypothetical protein
MGYDSRDLKWYIEKEDNHGDLRSINVGGSPDEDMVFAIVLQWTIVMIKKYAQGSAGLGKKLRVDSISLNKVWSHEREVDISVTLTGNSKKATLTVRVTPFCGSSEAPTSLLCQIVDRSAKDPRYSFSTIGAVLRKTDKARATVVTTIQLTDKATCP